MYLKFNKDKVTVAQLKAIAAILGLKDVEDLEWFYNIHYEACRYEIECVIENNIELSKLVEIKQREDYEELINNYADDLYYRADYQWDELYNKAEEIVDIDNLR